MAICMAKTIKEERLRWVLPIAQRQVKLVDVAKVCPYSTTKSRAVVCGIQTGWRGSSRATINRTQAILERNPHMAQGKGYWYQKENQEMCQEDTLAACKDRYRD